MCWFDSTDWRWLFRFCLGLATPTKPKFTAQMRTITFRVLSHRTVKPTVEVHTRLLARPTRLPLSTEEVFERAEMIDALGLRAFVPGDNDRLPHLIAHGAAEGHQFHRRHVILRECLDFYNLVDRVDLKSVEATFVEAELSSEFFSSLAIMEFLLKRPHSLETRRYRGWVRHTLRALASPRTQVYWITLDTLRHVATLLSTRSGWRHLSGNFTKSGPATILHLESPQLLSWKVSVSVASVSLLRCPLPWRVLTP